MAKQTFKTPLNFQNVPVGSLDDKVLMRTADGDIKELPSNSFGGGGVGSQNFQSVIEEGSNMQVFQNQEESSGNYYAMGFNLYEQDGENKVNTYIDQYYEKPTEEDPEKVDSARTTIKIDNGVLSIHQEAVEANGDGGHNSILSFENPLLGGINNIFQIPAKPSRFEEDGITPIPYKLATLDDISGGGGSQNLKQTLDNGNIAEYDGGTTAIALGIEVSGVNDRDSYIAHGNGEEEGSENEEASFIEVRNKDVILSNKYHGKISAMEMNSGDISITQGGTSGSVSLNFETPIANTSIKVPAKPAKSGGGEGNFYVLATLDDISEGGSQNLQDTLNNGTDAEYNEGKDYIWLLKDIDEGKRYFEINNTTIDGDLNNSSNINQESTTININNNVSNSSSGEIKSAGISIKEGSIRFNRDYTLDSSSASAGLELSFEQPSIVGGVKILVPAKEPRYEEDEETPIPYKIAVLEDITIQKAIENNGASEFEFAGGNQQLNIFDYDGDKNANVYLETYFEGVSSVFDIRPDLFSLRNSKQIDETLTNQGELGVVNGKPQINYLQAGGDSFATNVSFENLIGYTSLSYPSKTGEYSGVVATTSDIAVSNSTTTALSASDLSTAYPNSVVGTQVHCLSISAGALIYIKTASGWVQHSVTLVS